MNSALKEGNDVFSMNNGKVCHGRIAEVHMYDLLSLPRGIKFSKGFFVNWNIANSDKSTIIRTTEHQINEFGQTIFADVRELVMSVRNNHIANKKLILASCKDYYGLCLNKGDHIRKIDNNAFCGTIESIYMLKDDLVQIPLIRIVDDEGYFLAIDEDPRCYTTVNRYMRTKAGGRY